jgi:CheY-like chemotaxis protein
VLPVLPSRTIQRRPEMEGYETCRRLRTESFRRHAYIVAVTGWGQVHDRERAIADGFDAHLTKPADPRVLGELLGDAPKLEERSQDT